MLSALHVILSLPPEGERSNFERSVPLWGQNCGVNPLMLSHIDNLAVGDGVLSRVALSIRDDTPSHTQATGKKKMLRLAWSGWYSSSV